MASYQILNWQKLPSQIKVWDDFDELKVELPTPFIARIDQSAQEQGLTSTEDFLAQWNWGEEQSMEGSVSEVAEAVQRKLEES